jgi:DNA-binding transcriptional LysR family regulator
VALPSEMRSATWHFRHRNNGSADQVTLAPVYTVNSALMVRLGTLAHMGISIIPEGIVARIWRTARWYGYWVITLLMIRT